MEKSHRKRGLSHILLPLSLLIIAIIFGVRVAYSSVIYFSVAAIQFCVICLLAWKLGARAITFEDEKQRILAVAGGLLVMSWALFSFLPGIGPPGMQSHEENQLRYLILLIDTIALSGGFIILRALLSQSGEHFFSLLGFGAIVLSSPLYLVWAALMLGMHRAAAIANPSEPPAWIIALSDLTDILLFFGGILIYLATAAFAVSLGRTKWIGQMSTRTFVFASFIAVICLVSRGIAFPNPEVVFSHWYTIPGWVVGIPAIPWVMPCILGIVLLRRAGKEQS